MSKLGEVRAFLSKDKLVIYNNFFKTGKGFLYYLTPSEEELYGVIKKKMKYLEVPVVPPFAREIGYYGECRDMGFGYYCKPYSFLLLYGKYENPLVGRLMELYIKTNIEYLKDYFNLL